MPTENIPFGIKSGLEELKFDQIYRDFSETEYGETLAGNIRYGRYKPESVTNEEWELLLGPDVNNLKHLHLTYELTRQFVRDLKETLTDQEKEDLLLTAIVHDWAEAIVGDHTYDLKTADIETQELVEIKKMTAGMYGEDNESLVQRIHIVTDTILKDTDSKLGKMFNAVERVGYLRTALRAWRAQTEKTGELKLGRE